MRFSSRTSVGLIEGASTDIYISHLFGQGTAVLIGRQQSA